MSETTGSRPSPHAAAGSYRSAAGASEDAGTSTTRCTVVGIQDPGEDQDPVLAAGLDARGRRPMRQVLLGDYSRLHEIVSRWYLVLTLLARLPSIILPLTVLTYVAVASGSELWGAVCAACVHLGQALSVLVLARGSRIRLRQWILLLHTAVHVGVVCVLVYRLAEQARVAPEGTWPWHLALLAGLSAPQLGNATRLRWRAILQTHRRTDLNQASMRHDAVMDALALVLGALVTGVVAITVGPLVGIMVSTGLLVVAGTALLLHPTAGFPSWTPPRDPARTRPNAAMRRRRRMQRFVRLLPVLGGCCIGILLGSIQVGLVYFAASVDVVESIGAQFAGLGLMSGLAAMIAAGFVPRRPWNLWIIFGAATVIATMLMSVPSRPLGMVLILAVVGAAMGPTMIAVFGVVPLITPLREAAAISSATAVLIQAGMALGVVLAGITGYRAGYETAVLLPVVASTMLLVTGLVFTERRGKVLLEIPRDERIPPAVPPAD